KHKPGHIHFFKNMEPTDFLRLIYNSKALVGNSSVGVRESGYLGIPVVNIGSRQSGRDRAQNVLDVDYERNEIARGINKQVENGRFPSDGLYGSGEAGVKIADLLASVELKFDKKLTY